MRIFGRLHWIKERTPIIIDKSNRGWKAASPEFAFFSALGSQPCQAWAFSIEHDVIPVFPYHPATKQQ
jgi:hypothetical protein